MSRRVFWLWGALFIPLLIISLFVEAKLSALQVVPQLAAPNDVIVNEWSQGNGGSKEWVELLVVNGPLDLRAWDLGDSSPGDLIFADQPLWQNVPTGSRLLIYNGNDRDTILPPDDDDLSDCLAVLPHSSSFFSGSWPAFANGTAADNPHLRDAGGATVHDLTVAPGSLHPGANQSLAFLGATVVDVVNPPNWAMVAAAAATPGTGNGEANTSWLDGLCGDKVEGIDLQLLMTGPATAVAGTEISYEISVSNIGQLSAPDVVLTVSLPIGLNYVSGPFDVVNAGTLTWGATAMQPGESINLILVVQVANEASGNLINQAIVTTSANETNLTNNNVSMTTVVGNGGSAVVVLDAVLADGIENNDLDEAVALRNVGGASLDLTSWALSDGGSPKSLPPGLSLAPSEVLWLAHNEAAFIRQFGFAPGAIMTTWPGFANAGDEVLLLDDQNVLIDSLVYGSGNTAQAGWNGEALRPYTVTGVFGGTGQILYRRRDQKTGLPVPDTDQAVDWAQSMADPLNGRKVRYPGWDLDEFFFTQKATEMANVTIGIAPDNAFETVVAEINAAQNSLQIEALTFENLAIAEALVAAAQRGVAVTILLEGGPSGGLPDQEKYICKQLHDAGGQCWFMITDAAAHIADRYRFMHAKFIIVDGNRVAISSENLSPNSMPADDKQDGTWGRRGVVIVTDAPSVVGHVQTLFARDMDPDNHVDIIPWEESHPEYGLPTAGFVPISKSGGVSYTVRYPAPSSFIGTFAFELVQSPENSLRDEDGLLGLVNLAGSGDTVLVQQLQERPYWGATTSNAITDPNPRLEAYIDAARRGAKVQLQLDSYFDNSTSAVSNTATCAAVNTIAQQENLSIDCTLGNPAGLGIHNKMVLVEVNGRGTVHIGSLNGTEQSSKGNRELAIQIQSDEAYALLSDMFIRDIRYTLHMPLLLNNVQGAASHLLISEVLYDPFGQDDAEFIELVNPAPFVIDLSGYSLGDAVNRDDFEDVRRFPAGTLLGRNETLVVATTATAFFAEYGIWPDFEILETATAVPQLIDDSSWGDSAALLQLGNLGDEVILRDTNDHVVDVVTYGTGNHPKVVGCQVVSATGHSLERLPYWRDKDDCPQDFRDWPFPSPNQLP